MIESLQLQNFRSHRELNLSGLGRVNLLLGRNNSGKTAILEALFLAAVPSQSSEVVRLLNEARALNGNTFEDLWGPFFFGWKYKEASGIHWVPKSKYDHDSTSWRRRFMLTAQPRSFTESSPGVIESSDFSDGLNRVVVLFDTAFFPKAQSTSYGSAHRRAAPEIFQDADLPAAYLPARGMRDMTAEAQRFSSLELEGREELVLDALRLIEPTLSRLTVVAKDKSTALYARVGKGRLMPLSLMGDGMLRVLSIALSLARSQNGIVLIDEAENGLHYSVQEKVWRLIIETARKLNVQVFVTTHSDECLAAATRAAYQTEEMNDLRTFRCERADGATRVVDYTAQEMASALAFRQEMR